MKVTTITTAIAAALLLALTGCGEDVDQDDVDQAASEAVEDVFDAPACDEIDTIPEDFDGCEVDGELQAAIMYDCDDGRQLYAAGPVFGYAGEEARTDPEGADSAAYSALWDECKGY